MLIERGSEVGGGDARFGVGTIARVVRAQELPDGGYALATVGIRRLRVSRWLPDDPYPRAEVVDLGDETRRAATTHGRAQRFRNAPRRCGSCTAGSIRACRRCP